MRQKLPADQMRLYRRIDEALFYIWDPIGISNEVWCRDEYQSYLPVVFKIVMQESPRKELIEHLIKIETEHMELDSGFGTKKRIATFVDLLYDLKDDLIIEH